jgi:hypothetical protein
LLHTDRLPTAVSSVGNRFVMAASGEWASLAQLLASFAISVHDELGCCSESVGVGSIGSISFLID